MSRRSADDLVQDAAGGMMDDLAGTREMLDHRYDEVNRGEANLKSGDEVFDRFRAKGEALQQRRLP